MRDAYDLQGAEITFGVFVTLLVCWRLAWIKLAHDLPAPDESQEYKRIATKESQKQSPDAAAIVAKHVISGVCNTFYGCTGAILWIFTDLGNAHQTRTWGYAGDFWQVCLWGMLGYQLWDLFVCSTVPALRSPASLGHHSVTALLCYLCTYPYIQYYSMFFVGFSEVSTIALAVMDIFKVLPHLAERHPVAYENARVTFAVLFLAVRVCYWPTVSYAFWCDSLELLNSGEQHSTAATMTFLVANTGLTLLQFFWGYLVIMGIKKKFSKSKKPMKAN